MSASVGINVQPTSSIMQEVEDVDFQQSKKYLSFLVATTNTAGTGIHPLIIGNVRVKRDRKRCFFKYCVYCLMVTSSGSSICTFTAGQIQRIYRQETYRFWNKSGIWVNFSTQAKRAYQRWWRAQCSDRI